MTFKLIKTQGKARRGEISTVHGVVQTPLFMNVGTCAAIRGGVSAIDLNNLKCQIELSNTYHLHVRPGEAVINAAGGIRKFINWDKPVLTDSGGFQVYSLAKLRNIKEEGVTFANHMDGGRVFMSPEVSMQIQSSLASTIAMAFDECPPSIAEYGHVKTACERTARWLYRCKDEMLRLNSSGTAINPEQSLFGICQGGIYKDLRIDHMKTISELDLEGYALGGLAVGETARQMYEIINYTEPHMPNNKPRYLMGVGTPINLLEAVSLGIDMFDCVMPSRNARHGNLFTSVGQLNVNNEKFMYDYLPIDENCGCETCKSHSRAYIRHLFKAREMLGMRLCVMHNLYFYNNLMEEIRSAIEDGSFEVYKNNKIEAFTNRV